MVRILGISAFYHDSAAALIEDGEIVSAAQEERFTRIKGDASFPHHAIGWCLDDAGITIQDVDHVVFYEQPVIKFERLLTSYLATAPRGLRSFLHAMPSWLTNKLWLEREIARELGIHLETLRGWRRQAFSSQGFSVSFSITTAAKPSRSGGRFSIAARSRSTS